MVLQQAFTQVYSLYKQIGYNELDTIGKTFNRLDQIVEYYDSSAEKPPDFQLIVQTRDRLSAYLTSFNEFHEEIYSVEDNLLSLENSYNAGNIGEAELKKWVKLEDKLLENIQSRIISMRQKADSTLSSITSVKIDNNYSLSDSQ